MRTYLIFVFLIINLIDLSSTPNVNYQLFDEKYFANAELMLSSSGDELITSDKVSYYCYFSNEWISKFCYIYVKTGSIYKTYKSEIKEAFEKPQRIVFFQNKLYLVSQTSIAYLPISELSEKSDFGKSLKAVHIPEGKILTNLLVVNGSLIVNTSGGPFKVVGENFVPFYSSDLRFMEQYSENFYFIRSGDTISAFDIRKISQNSEPIFNSKLSPSSRESNFCFIYPYEIGANKILFLDRKTLIANYCDYKNGPASTIERFEWRQFINLGSQTYLVEKTDGSRFIYGPTGKIVISNQLLTKAFWKDRSLYLIGSDSIYVVNDDHKLSRIDSLPNGDDFEIYEGRLFFASANKIFSKRIGYEEQFVIEYTGSDDSTITYVFKNGYFQILKKDRFPEK